MPRILMPVAIAILLFSGAHTVLATDLGVVLTDALKNDPKIGAARAGFLARNEIVPQSRAALLPQISLSGSREDDQRRQNPTGKVFEFYFDQHSWQAELRQPILAVTKYYNLRTAEAQRDAARYDLSSAEQDLLLRVADAYFNVLRAQDQLDSTKAEETAVKRQLEQVQQRFDVGLVAITDVLDAQAVHDNSVVRRIQADSNLDIFFENLHALAGINYDSIDKLSAKLPVIYPEPRDEDQWVNEALASNTAIKSAQESLLAAQRDVNARRADALPTIDAVATYSEFRTSSAASFGASDSRAYVLQARMPVFQGGAIASRVREGRYRATQSEQLLEDKKRTVSRDTRNLFRSVLTDVVRVRAGEKSIQSSKAALDASQTGYEVGTRNIVDVLQAQQRLYQAEFTYADSRYSYVTDLLRLKQAAGQLTARDLIELNAFISPTDAVKKQAIGHLYEEDANAMAPTAVPNDATGPLAVPPAPIPAAPAPRGASATAPPAPD